MSTVCNPGKARQRDGLTVPREMDTDEANGLGKGDILYFAKARDMLPTPLTQDEHLATMGRETMPEHRRIAVVRVHRDRDMQGRDRVHLVCQVTRPDIGQPRT